MIVSCWRLHSPCKIVTFWYQRVNIQTFSSCHASTHGTLQFHVIIWLHLAVIQSYSSQENRLLLGTWRINLIEESGVAHSHRYSHVPMHTFIHMHICSHTLAYIYTNSHKCSFTLTRNTYMCAHTVYVYTHAYMHTYTVKTKYTHVHIDTYAYVHTCLYTHIFESKTSLGQKAVLGWLCFGVRIQNLL